MKQRILTAVVGLAVAIVAMAFSYTIVLNIIMSLLCVVAVFEIVETTKASANKFILVVAMLYGALIAGGTSMSWDEFDAAFKLDSIDGIRDIILKGVADSLPKADDAKDGAENP